MHKKLKMILTLDWIHMRRKLQRVIIWQEMVIHNQRHHFISNINWVNWHHQNRILLAVSRSQWITHIYSKVNFKNLRKMNQMKKIWVKLTCLSQYWKEPLMLHMWIYTQSSLIRFLMICLRETWIRNTVHITSNFKFSTRLANKLRVVISCIFLGQNFHGRHLYNTKMSPWKNYLSRSWYWLKLTWTPQST